MTQPAQPRLACTVAIVRDGDKGPEIFMVRRHQKNKFMANATVFVGGRVDDADADSSLWTVEAGLPVGEAAKRIGVTDHARVRAIYTAGVRETFEESGVLLARAADGEMVGPDGLAQMREALNAGEATFLDLLGGDKSSRWTAAFSELRYLAHWITPEFEPRRYDTYFFVCRMPPGQVASYDDRETTAGDWYRPEDLLSAATRKEVLLAPPTLCVLEDLSGAAAADELLSRAKNEPTSVVMPKPLTHGATALTLLFPGDHRYDDPSSPSGPEHYVVLRDGYWERVRS